LYSTCWAGHHADIRPWNVWGVACQQVALTTESDEPQLLVELGTGVTSGRTFPAQGKRESGHVAKDGLGVPPELGDQVLALGVRDVDGEPLRDVFDLAVRLEERNLVARDVPVVHELAEVWRAAGHPSTVGATGPTGRPLRAFGDCRSGAGARGRSASAAPQAGAKRRPSGRRPPARCDVQRFVTNAGSTAGGMRATDAASLGPEHGWPVPDTDALRRADTPARTGPPELAQTAHHPR